MDLVKAWGVAIVTFALSSVVLGYVEVSAADPQQILTGVSHYLWVVIPAIVIYLLTSLLAAIFHGTGHGAGRHALAVLAVPVAGLLVTLAGSLVQGTSAGDAVLSVVAAIIGMIVGWQLIDRLRKEREKTSTDTYW